MMFVWVVLPKRLWCDYEDGISEEMGPSKGEWIESVHFFFETTLKLNTYFENIESIYFRLIFSHCVKKKKNMHLFFFHF